MTLFLDCETYSAVPISAGVYRYAEEAEVIVITWCVDDGPVKCWHLGPGPSDMLDEFTGAFAAADTIIAHNAQFDRVVIERALGIYAPLSKWLCTKVLALVHTLPGALDALAEHLKLGRKTKGGKDLVRLFCMPRKGARVSPTDQPDKWKDFLNYARNDTKLLRKVYKVLPKISWTDTERALYVLDQTINDRGFAVDVQLAHAAIAGVGKAQDAAKLRTRDATNDLLDSPAQRDAVMEWLLQEHGISVNDLRKATLSPLLDDPSISDGAKLLIRDRLLVCTNSVAKYKALVKSVSRDGRLRGTLQFHGASRTGRWSGRTFQPQNLPRPSTSPSSVSLGIEALKRDGVDLFFECPVTVARDSIRGCVIADPGKQLIVCDLANIEGRVLAWLAGEAWKLEAFAAYDAGTGPDLYIAAYAKSFNADPDTVTDDQRQIGKVLELAMGYAGGAGAFVTFASAMNIDLRELTRAAKARIPPAELKAAKEFMEWLSSKTVIGLDPEVFIVVDALKRVWRRAHPATVAFWRALSEASTVAIAGEVGTAGRYIETSYAGDVLHLRLPSGRKLCYNAPRIKGKDLSYTMPLRQMTIRVSTHGGKLAENACQAVARDILAEGIIRAESSNYPVVLSAHDELVSEVPIGSDFNNEGLRHAMTAPISWAPGIPLSAKAFTCTRYRK